MSTTSYDDLCARVYGGTPDSAAPREDTEPTDKRPGQRQAKKHAALEKFQLANSFTVGGMRHLSSTAASVWWILWNWSTDGIETISHLGIAEQLGKGEKTAARGTSELEAKGFVVVLKRGGKQLGPNTYQLIGCPHLDRIVRAEQSD